MITKLYKGDASTANGRAILIQLPDTDLTGLSIVFDFLNKRVRDDSPTRNSTIRVDFTAEESARLPLGTHYGRLSIVRNGSYHTASATVPIDVTDDVAEVYGGDAANINLEMRFCSGIPDLATIEKNPATPNALADAFRALIQKLQGGVAIALALCACACLGDVPKYATSGSIPFDRPVITNAESAFAPMSHTEDRANPHGVTAAQIGALNAAQAAQIVDQKITKKADKSWVWNRTDADGMFYAVGGGSIGASMVDNFWNYLNSRFLAADWGAIRGKFRIGGSSTNEFDQYIITGDQSLGSARIVCAKSGTYSIARNKVPFVDQGHSFSVVGGSGSGVRIFFADGSPTVTVPEDYEFELPETFEQMTAKYGSKYFATSNDVAAVRAIAEAAGSSDQITALSSTVAAWEGYWGGSNVCFEVTNYYGNTSGEIPKLRIKELITEGAGAPYYKEVWNDITKFDIFTSNLTQKIETEVAGYVSTNAAPRAWGTVTDKGSPNPVTNSVWMTSPQTVFAGGTEYQRVAVGTGAICVLTARGAEAYTAGEAGTFRFQDEGGTNYFGFAKTDSYTIGCNTDGITVEGGLVTLTYNVIMAAGTYPVIYYRPNLCSGSWAQLNNEDGSAATGAPYSVTFGASGGSVLAFLNVGTAPHGFFKAETSVAGDVVFETNMKMRLDGGVLCTDGQTIIYPHADGTWGTTR